MSQENTSTAAPIVEEPIESTEVIETPEEVEGSEAENEEVAAAEAAKSPKDAKAAAKKSAEIKKELKKLKIKFNGKEEDLEFDPTDDDYLTKQFQLARLGQTKAQEYSKLEKEVDQFINLLKTNPRAVLSDPTIGVDLKKFVNDYIEEELTNAQKSPEQIEKEKLESELKTLKEEQKKRDEEFKQKEFERMQELAYQTYDNQIAEALGKTNMPKNAYTIKKIADFMLLGLQNNMDVTPEDVIPLVQQEIQNDIKEMFGVMPDEVIEQMIGKDTISRLRKKSVAKAKQVPTPLSKIKDVGKPGKAEAAPEKKQSYRDFFKL